VGPQAHSGLYNALTCDYKASIADLKIELNNKTLERNKLFHEYQRLIAQVTNQTEKLNRLNHEVKLIEDDISSIEMLLTKVKNKNAKGSLLTVSKLKSKLNKLNHDILNKSTFFDLDDAEFTSKKLLENNDNIKYASTNQNNASKYKQYVATNQNDASKYKQYVATNQNEFKQAYTKDLKQDKDIRVLLSSKIKTLHNAITSDNITTSTATIDTLINEIKQYKDSIKSSAS
jgi:septal ring factor EnvC (AmiA/AmiB activator)